MIVIDSDNKRYFKDCGMHKWHKVELRNLAKGDRFKVYTQVGEPIVIDDTDTFVARSDPYQNQGKWEIQVEM